MNLGPVEILCVKFPNNFALDEIATALRALVDAKTIRIFDIVFIKKQENGEVQMSEIDDLDDVNFNVFDPIIDDVSGLIPEEDVQAIAQTLDSNSFAALMLFENVWATAFRDAVLNAKGELLLNDRIPSSVVEQIISSQLQPSI